MPIPTRILELINRLRDRLHRDALGAELDDELRFHRAMVERDHRHDGASADEARRRTARQVGNTTYLKEEARAMWSLGWIDDALQDAHYALRVLRRNPVFTAAVVLTLALGIGANTAIFSVVNAVVLRQLPYANPERLYSVWTSPARSPSDRHPTSYLDLQDWKQRSTAFAGLEGYAFNRFEITDGTAADAARAILATGSLYSTLGAKAEIGRLPTADEEHQPVVAISHRLWLRRYGGDPAVIGRSIQMDETSYKIVGVMPAGFHFPTPDIDLWMTIHNIADAPGQSRNSPWLTNRGLRGYRVVARLKPGVSARTAEAQLNAIMHQLGRDYPTTDAAIDIHLQSVRGDSTNGIENALWLILGAAGLVLLLACMNIAHLMLARTSARTREIAVRRALGADRSRVVRQLITESVILGLLGGALGLVVATLGARAFVALSPADIPRLETVAIDGRTMAFAAIISIATGVLFGLAPAVSAWGAAGQTSLREGRGGTGGRRASRARDFLTSGEVAFALVLLVGAGLMLRTFASLLRRDLGFSTEGVTAFHVSLSSSRYASDEAKARVVASVMANIRAIPGVTLAGGSSSLPPARMQQSNGFTIAGDPQPAPNEAPTALYVPASPQFLSALGVRLVAGREFTEGDDRSAPRVAVISRELAQRYFANRDPIGHQIRADDTLRTIVGVVGDVPYNGLAEPVGPAVYVPYAQSPFGGVWIAVRSSLDAAALSSSIRDALQRVDPLMTARDIRPMTDYVSESMLRARFQTMLLGGFGVLALVLAAVGIYGVISYSVAQRTNEIGLRLALGATPRSVVRLVMARGLTPVGLGLIGGIAGSAVLSKLIQGLLYGISPTDRVTFVMVTLVLTAVATAAAYLPAARAARLDPLGALRSD